MSKMYTIHIYSLGFHWLQTPHYYHIRLDLWSGQDDIQIEFFKVICYRNFLNLLLFMKIILLNWERRTVWLISHLNGRWGNQCIWEVVLVLSHWRLKSLNSALHGRCCPHTGLWFSSAQFFKRDFKDVMASVRIFIFSHMLCLFRFRFLIFRFTSF